MRLNKYENNPILKPNPENTWESLVVCNPAVWYENGKWTMLYRAAGNDMEHKIYLGLATSQDGYHFTRVFDEPVLSPSPNHYDAGCIEDPRVVKFGETYYITYAYRPFPPGRYWEENKPVLPRISLDEFSPEGLVYNKTNSALAITNDFIHYKKLGRITKHNLEDRDVILFPEKVNGKYVMLHRPHEWVGMKYGCEVPSIWISFSSDLMVWRDSTLLATSVSDWDNKKLGGSTPPIKTSEGWLVLYHGVSLSDDLYRVGVLLLDLENPTKIIARAKDFIMEPEFDYETQGFYNGCVFPTGNVVVEDTLYVYYGAGDRFVCVATCLLNDLLCFVKENNIVK